ncbi:thioredoxin family protein [Echinicola sp. CAU 1574]|uniref:Thioredoxin family protein n=1 Tax=Echinicola arenosa TaxID=2774144 RepID=A0ABR9AGA4_9BACT|nr:thioredoxin fold domain-containing protein [Echinicola arenosa]MBD8487756.1 thioredoxin family protein [Echinicola arenosa]
MKRFSLTLMALILVIFSGYAQDPFFQGSWKEVLDEAKEQKKLIFVDLYFEGCMPCEKMAKEVFPHPEVSKLLESDFISFKSDVFKEEDGALLSRKFGATGFPSFVFLNHEGKVLDVASGYLNVNGMVSALKEMMVKAEEGDFTAFDPSLDLDYPAFYSEFFISQNRKLDGEEIKQYMASQTDWNQEVPFMVLSTFARGGQYDQYYWTNAESLGEQYGYGIVSKRMFGIATSQINQFAAAKQIKRAQGTINIIKDFMNEKDVNRFTPFLLNRYYKEDPQHLWYLQEYRKLDIDSRDQVFNVISGVLQHLPEDEATLNAMKEWYEESVLTEQPDAEQLYNYSLILALMDKASGAQSELDKIQLKDNDSNLTAQDVELLSKAIASGSMAGYQPKELIKEIPVLQ